MFQELSFIAYYYHWDEGTLLQIGHRQRRRWCKEISRIHKGLNSSRDGAKSILEWGRG